MPYHRIQPSASTPDQELVAALAHELSVSPEISDAAAPDEHLSDPTIPDVQEEITHRNIMHVRVIWDRWSSMSLEQRGEIIVEAYKRAQGEEVARRISIAMGLTSPEAKRLGFAN